MGNAFAARGGFTLMRTPSHRQQVARRRLVVVAAVFGLALASGVIGSLTARTDVTETGRAYIGPSSYFPSE
ncbi:hypothetical protein [Phenylobacterium sp.]|jgi:hypothetical protein|uniref:hypothetical protein n=1 Tax=Phenylobacterium sp. TaxID=1871053 RepID=UPI003784BE2F